MLEVIPLRNKHSRVPDALEFKSPAGDLFHDVYSSYYKPDGSIGLKVSDRVDIKKEINSYRDETDMSYILSRLMAGDDSVLNPRPPMYGDFTQLPSSYADMLNMVIEGSRYFDSLPLDIRNKFDNDHGKWFASIGSDSWLESMGFVSHETLPNVPVVNPEPNVPVVNSDIIKDKEVIE